MIYTVTGTDIEGRIVSLSVDAEAAKEVVPHNGEQMADEVAVVLYATTFKKLYNVTANRITPEERLKAMLNAAPADPYARNNHDQLCRNFVGWMINAAHHNSTVAEQIEAFVDSFEKP